MKLYAHRLCPFSRRVRIALAEHAIEHEYVEMAPGEPHPEELKGKTPMASGVPVLFVRDNFVLWDSGAMLYWIDSAFPQSLMPSQCEPKSLAYSWAGFATKQYALLKKLADGEADAEKKIVENLREMEPLLQDKWLVGSDFSNADVSLAPVLAVLSPASIDSLPENVRAWAGRVKARPSVRQVCELDSVDRPNRAA